jgi:hypothetical protein
MAKSIIFLHTTRCIRIPLFVFVVNTGREQLMESTHWRDKQEQMWTVESGECNQQECHGAVQHVTDGVKKSRLPDQLKLFIM